MGSDSYFVKFEEEQNDFDEVADPVSWWPAEGENFRRLSSSQKIKLNKISLTPDEAHASWVQEVIKVASRSITPTETVAARKRVTQLVVGRIQAGKTGNFTGLIALLADNDYPLFVVIAGTSRNLRDQTAFRLAEDLGHFNFNFVVTGEGPFGKAAENLRREIERNLVDWHDAIRDGSIRPKPMCITVLKSTQSHLDFVNEVFESLSARKSTSRLLERTPVLIIDDECDSASPNANVNQPERARAATNAAIVRLRESAPFHTYVGYTATPQAQVLMDIDDVLKPQRVTSLEAGGDYVGVEELFADDSKFATEIAAWDATKKMPDSLRAAFAVFVVQSFLFHHPSKVVRSSVISPPLLDDTSASEKPVSMLVHVDRAVKLSRSVISSLESLRQEWIKTLKTARSSSGAMEGSQKNLYEKFLVPAIESFGVEELMVESDLLQGLRNELIGTELRLVISEGSGGDAYPSEEEFKTRRAWVLVGAVLLDRGQTLPNLLNTYLARSSGGGAKGREAGGNIDTLLQRGRFFGHRKQYSQLLRGYFSPTALESYKKIAVLEPIWRKGLSRIDHANLELAAYPMLLELIPDSPKLGPVRKQIIPKGVKRVRSSGWFLRESWVSAERSAKNLNLLTSRMDDSWSRYLKQTAHWRDRHLSFELPWEHGVDFVNEWEVDLGDSESKSVALEVLGYLSGQSETRGIEVLLMNRLKVGARSHEPTYLRNVQRARGESFQTAGLLSSTDRKFVLPDRPTIQIHFLKVSERNGAEVIPRGVGLGLHIKSLAYVKTNGRQNE